MLPEPGGDKEGLRGASALTFKMDNLSSRAEREKQGMDARSR